MKRGVGIALGAALAFLIITVTRLPAEWLLPASLTGHVCTTVDGSLWSGGCSGIKVGAVSLGDLAWHWRPLALLRGRLAARVTLTGGITAADAEVELGFGERLTLRNLRGDAPLDPSLFPGVPSNLQGHVHFELALAQVERGAITQLKGSIEARDLEERSGADTALGSYIVSFPGAPGDPVGQVRDVSGPLALEGTLRLTRAPGFELEGFVAPRRGAAPAVVSNLRFLGPPDAAGRRQFSLSGTF